MGGFMKHAVEISSGVMIYIPSFIQIGSDIQTLIWGYTDRWEGFMKHAVEMSSGVMIYIPSFIQTGSGSQKLMGGWIHVQHADAMSLFLKVRKIGCKDGRGDGETGRRRTEVDE
jgi:hypothetical protein